VRFCSVQNRDAEYVAVAATVSPWPPWGGVRNFSWVLMIVTIVLRSVTCTMDFGQKYLTSIRVRIQRRFSFI
jgi:hypothetical protein